MVEHLDPLEEKRKQASTTRKDRERKAHSHRKDKPHFDDITHQSWGETHKYISGKILGAEGNITKEANTYVEGSAQINSCSDHTIHLVQGGIR
jgi:hypothetical protein